MPSGNPAGQPGFNLKKQAENIQRLGPSGLLPDLEARTPKSL
jgi:hypothetical protein